MNSSVFAINQVVYLTDAAFLKLMAGLFVARLRTAPTKMAEG